MAAKIAEQQQQQAELQVRTLELEQALAAARQALADSQAQHGENAPRLRQAFAAQDNLARLDQELAAQRSTSQQAEQQVADGQQQLQQLEDNQQRSLQQLAQIDTALADSQHLAGLANAWHAYLPQLKQVMLTGGRLAKGREELPGLQAQASQANAHLQAERDAYDLLFREARPNRRPLPSKSTCSVACCRTTASSSAPSKNCRACMAVNKSYASSCMPCANGSSRPCSNASN